MIANVVVLGLMLLASVPVVINWLVNGFTLVMTNWRLARTCAVVITCGLVYFLLTLPVNQMGVLRIDAYIFVGVVFSALITPCFNSWFDRGQNLN